MPNVLPKRLMTETETSPTPDPLHEQRQHCIAEALHCFGTSAVFGERARLLRRRIGAISYLGVALPGLVGVAVASFGIAAGVTAIFIGVAAACSIPLFALSAWSLAQNWPDQLAYAEESRTANRRLSDAFARMAKDQTLSQRAYKTDLRLLDQENDARSTLDEKRYVSEDEKRFGMRAALRQLQKTCAGCSRVPQSLDSTDCDVCGNFKLRKF